MRVNRNPAVVQPRLDLSDWSAARYRERANRHRPTDIGTVIHEMRRAGLKANDIAEALNLGIGAVEQLIGPEPLASSKAVSIGDLQSG